MRFRLNKSDLFSTVCRIFEGKQMSRFQRAIIDLEFTGLDNTFVTDNEIVQAKVMNLRTGVAACHNFHSNKRLSAYNQVTHGVSRYAGDLFSKQGFHELLEQVQIRPQRKTMYFGFGVQQDIRMLAKYGIDIEITDLREMVQRSRHEARMATEGSNLETVYFILTGMTPQLDSHNGLSELNLIHEIYKKAIRLKKKTHLEVMPHGHCAGMPLRQYVRAYRRAADGYRFNNNDLLAQSLTRSVPVPVWDDEDDEFDDDDYEFDDDDEY